MLTNAVSVHRTVLEVIWFRLLKTFCTREDKQVLLGHVS